MNTDKRYSTVRKNIESGEIKEFNEIFEYIPKSVVAEALGTSVKRFTRFIDEPYRFECVEIYDMSQLFEVPLDKFFTLVMKGLVRERELLLNAKKRAQH